MTAFIESKLVRLGFSFVVDSVTVMASYYVRRLCAALTIDLRIVSIRPTETTAYRVKLRVLYS